MTTYKAQGTRLQQHIDLIVDKLNGYPDNQLMQDAVKLIIGLNELYTENLKTIQDTYTKNFDHLHG